MSAPTETVPTPTEPPAFEPHPITLGVYRSMADLGLIQPADRVVLFRGQLVKKMTKGARHSTAATVTFKRLIRLLPEGWTARKEDPIEIGGLPGGDSAPEPDLAVVVGSDADYRDRQPRGSDAAIVIEFAANAAAVRRDRLQVRDYAFAGIPTAWIVNLVDRVVEVWTGPSGPSPAPGYAGLERVDRSGQLSFRAGEHEVGPFPAEELLA